MLGTLAAMAKPWPHMLMSSSATSCTQLAARQARRGARHNGGCREPAGREAQAQRPRTKRAPANDCGASWQQPVMLNRASDSPRSDCQARAGSMPGWACPRGPRAQRAGFLGGRAPMSCPAARGLLCKPRDACAVGAPRASKFSGAVRRPLQRLARHRHRRARPRAARRLRRWLGRRQHPRYRLARDRGLAGLYSRPGCV